MRFRVSLVVAILAATVLVTLCSGVALAAPSLRSAAPAQYIQTVAGLVDQYGMSLGKPPAVWTTVDKARRDACGPVDPAQTMEFCGLDRRIYVGTGIVQEFKAYHYLAPAIGEAHEYGHYLQLLADSGSFSENQADCVAGAWLAWANQRLGLGLSPADLPGLALLVVAISNVGDAGDPHGSFIDRSSAMAEGFAMGIGRCDHFDPSHPLV